MNQATIIGTSSDHLLIIIQLMEWAPRHHALQGTMRRSSQPFTGAFAMSLSINGSTMTASSELDEGLS